MGFSNLTIRITNGSLTPCVFQACMYAGIFVGGRWGGGLNLRWSKAKPSRKRKGAEPT